jgi:hypothetical protein
MKRTFRVKRNYQRILRSRKARIERRLRRPNWSNQAEPMPRRGNVRYELADRTKAVGCGGLKFILGLDVNPKAVALPDSLSAKAWTPLRRVPKYEILTTT